MCSIMLRRRARTQAHAGYGVKVTSTQLLKHDLVGEDVSYLDNVGAGLNKMRSRKCPSTKLVLGGRRWESQSY